MVLQGEKIPFLDLHTVDNLVLMPADCWHEALGILRNDLRIVFYDLFIYFTEGPLNWQSELVQTHYLQQIKKVSIDVHKCKKNIIFTRTEINIPDSILNLELTSDIILIDNLVSVG